MYLPFEKQAMSGDPLPAGMIQEDQLAYLSIRELYRQLRIGAIDRVRAAEEKRLIENAWRKNVNASVFGRSCQEYSAKFYRNIESAITAYFKNRTIENADRLAMAVDGVDKPLWKAEWVYT